MNTREISETLLEELKAGAYPNCTLYLIWHYMAHGQPELAAAEYVRDCDKLSQPRRLLVQAALEHWLS